MGVVPEVNDQAVSTDNPLPVSVVGGGSGSGSAGSVTAPGANGTQAQAVQGIAGGVPQPVVQADTYMPGGTAGYSLSAAGTLFTADMAQYPGASALSVHIVSVASGSSYVLQQSNDGTNWTLKAFAFAHLPGTQVDRSNDNTPGAIIEAQITARYVRLITTGYTSGTTTVIPALRTGSAQPRSTWVAGGTITANALLQPGSAAANGISPVVTTGSSLVGKASAGNIYGWSVTMGASAGYMALLNVAAAPAAGAAIAPLECVPVAANSYVARRQDIADRFAAGIVAVATSSCATFTAVTPQVMSLVVQ